MITTGSRERSLLTVHSPELDRGVGKVLYAAGVLTISLVVPIASSSTGKRLNLLSDNIV